MQLGQALHTKGVVVHERRMRSDPVPVSTVQSLLLQLVPQSPLPGGGSPDTALFRYRLALEKLRVDADEDVGGECVRERWWRCGLAR